MILEQPPLSFSADESKQSLKQEVIQRERIGDSAAFRYSVLRLRKEFQMTLHLLTGVFHANSNNELAYSPAKS
jgi:hypothetical protein